MSASAATVHRLFAAASQPPDSVYADATSALRWLRQLAWGDLQHARAHAWDGQWSIACESAVERIVGLTKLIGPEPRDSVPTALVKDGLYDLLHEAAGYSLSKDPT